MFKILDEYVFSFLLFISKSEISGSYGKSMSSHLRNYKALLQGGVPISPHPSQLLLLSCLMLAMLVGVM
jgi:hypothetical protein